MCFWQWVINNHIILIEAFGSGGIIALVIGLFIAKKSLTQPALTDLLKEYRSYKMGFAIRELWYCYRELCNEDEETWIKYYVNRFFDDDEGENSLHNLRRIVSQFYQQVATLYYNRGLRKKIVKIIWFDLAIVEKILLPIAIEAMSIIVGEEITVEKDSSLYYMFKLCNEFRPFWDSYKEKDDPNESDC